MLSMDKYLQTDWDQAIFHLFASEPAKNENVLNIVIIKLRFHLSSILIFKEETYQHWR